MTFQTIEKGTWHSNRKEKSINRVTYACPPSQNTGVMVFSVSEDLAKDLGDPKRVKVMLGTGEHKGKILVKRATDDEPNSYAFTRQPSARIRKFTVSRYRLGMKGKLHYKTTTTSHRMTEEGLMVWLPE